MSDETEREQRVRGSFSRQGFMRHLGAEVTKLGPGECEIQVPYRDEMTQQHGYFHAGVAAAIADSACGYAAYGLMPGNVVGEDGGVQDIIWWRRRRERR